ncbi:hypothetical protein ACTXT7_010235 [Hymenolepis weldensis]
MVDYSDLVTLIPPNFGTFLSDYSLSRLKKQLCPPDKKLSSYGRRHIDGELRVLNHIDSKSKIRYMKFTMEGQPVLVFLIKLVSSFAPLSFTFKFAQTYVFLFDKILLLCKSKLIKLATLALDALPIPLV